MTLSTQWGEPSPPPLEPGQPLPPLPPSPPPVPVPSFVSHRQLFGDIELTAKECKYMEYKKTVFELAEQRISMSGEGQRYAIPSADDVASGVEQGKGVEGLFSRCASAVRSNSFGYPCASSC